MKLFKPSVLAFTSLILGFSPMIVGIIGFGLHALMGCKDSFNTSSLSRSCEIFASLQILSILSLWSIPLAVLGMICAFIWNLSYKKKSIIDKNETNNISKNSFSEKDLLNLFSLHEKIINSWDKGNRVLPIIIGILLFLLSVNFIFSIFISLYSLPTLFNFYNSFFPVFYELSLIIFKLIVVIPGVLLFFNVLKRFFSRIR